VTFFLGFKAPWAILDNGTVQLGIGPYGELNVPGGTESAGGGGVLPRTASPDGSNVVEGPPGVTTVGLRNVALNWEGVAPGTPAEGWGLADLLGKQDGGVRSSMFPSYGPPPLAEGDGWNGIFDVSPVSFSVGGAGTLPESVGDRAVVVTDVGDPPFARVVHDFRPSENPNLYVVRVRVESLVFGPELTGGVGIWPRYRRTIDWDAENTALQELVTLGVVGDIDLKPSASEGQGFQIPRPLTPLVSSFCPSGDVFEYCGPDDLGIAIDWDFPPLATGTGFEFFRLFYGTATTQAAALAALEQVDARLYSFGQTSEDVPALQGVGPMIDPAMTYIFAFRDVIFEDGFETGDTSIWNPLAF